MKGWTIWGNDSDFPVHPTPAPATDEIRLPNHKNPVSGLHVGIGICKCMCANKFCDFLFQLNQRIINARRVPEIYCNYSSNTCSIIKTWASMEPDSLSSKATQIFRLKCSFNMLLNSQAAMESSLTLYFLSCFYRQNWSIRGKKKASPLISNIVGSLSESVAGL